MGYPSFAHRDRGVVKILGRSAIGFFSYWVEEITTITQECVICGTVYVDEQNLGDLDHPITHPRANPTEESFDTDNDVQDLHIPNPAELKNNVTNPPAAIHFTVCCELLYSLKQLKRACRTQHPPIHFRSMGTRGEHVHQTFISLPPHVCTVHKDYHQHTQLRKHWARCVSVIYLRVLPIEDAS